MARAEPAGVELQSEATRAASDVCLADRQAFFLARERCSLGLRG